MSIANLLITLFVINSWAQGTPDKGSEPIEEVSHFKPHMLDHPYKGCPTNSLCAKKMGELRSKWLKVLSKNKPSALDKFRKKNGIPVNIWTRDTVLKHPNLIIWDSFCKKHNPKPNTEGLINTEEKIYIAQVWAKNFDDIKKSFKEGNEVLVNRAYVLDESKKVTTYRIPRAEAPLFISDGKMYFTVEEEGNYFGLWVDSRGNIKIDQTYLPKSFPDEVKCPEILSKAFQAGIRNQKLFEGFFCKAIWNQSTKKFNTVALGWSCN